MKTAHDAREARQRLTPREAREYAARMRAENEAATLAAHPEIGVLIRRGKRVFYSFRSGVYRESRNLCELTKNA